MADNFSTMLRINGYSMPFLSVEKVYPPERK